MNEEEQMRIFFEIHQGNLLEAPGDFDSTQRAFSRLKDLPAQPHILDAGCGPGRQTFDLCRLTEGSIVAVDLHRPFVEVIKEKSREKGLVQRVNAMQADMADLEFDPLTFDVIWSEGAVYNIGFKTGLELWKPLLKKPGYVAVTEITWLREDIPADLKDFWNAEYPPMQDISSNINDLQGAGYRLVDHFTLPESAWWNYYRPIEKRVEQLKARYQDNSAALEVLDAELKEIDLYRRYSDYYGYEFFIGQNA